MGHQSIHDIHLRFTVPDIYETFAINTTYPELEYSGDIRLPYWHVNNATIQITIHKTNTVSVVLACSREPFPLNYSGIVTFFTTLGGIHGLVVGIMLSIYSADINRLPQIPSFSDWTIRMWHFGRDSLIEYSGKGVHDTVEKAGYILRRIYSKNFGNGKHKLRYEVQEYPNKNPFDAIEEKLINSNSDNSPTSTQIPQIETKEEVEN